MAEIAWQIPLQAGATIQTPNQLAALQKTMVDLQNARIVQQGQNALRALYGNPANFDQKTMQPTPEAFNKLMAVSPAVGLDLQKSLIGAQELRTRQQFNQSKIADEYRSQAREIADEALGAYEEALKTMPPQAALAKAQEVYSERVGAWKPSLPPEIAARVSPTFDPMRARAFVTTEAQRQQAAKTEKAEARADRTETRETQRLKMDKTRTDLAVAESTQKGIGIMYSPSLGRNVRYNERTGETTELDGVTGIKTPPDLIKPPTQTQSASREQEIAKAVEADDQAWLAQHPEATTVPQDVHFQHRVRREQAMGQATHAPRSAVAMYMNQFLQSHPGATDEQIAMAAARYRKLGAMEQAFGSGSQGNTIRSLNVAIDHTDVMQQLGDALQNGNTQKINALKNRLLVEFGYSGPVNFEFAKQIVGDEIVKAVLGNNAGTGPEREALQNQFRGANSPEQLRNVIRVARRLMLGQMRGLEFQYAQSDPARRETFRQALFDHTKEALEATDRSAEGQKPTEAKPAATPQQTELPAEARAMLKEGVETTFGNGQVWTLKDGKAARVR